jgi:hypothetical protein
MGSIEPRARRAGPLGSPVFFAHEVTDDLLEVFRHLANRHERGFMAGPPGPGSTPAAQATNS